MECHLTQNLQRHGVVQACQFDNTRCGDGRLTGSLRIQAFQRALRSVLLPTSDVAANTTPPFRKQRGVSELRCLSSASIKRLAIHKHASPESALRGDKHEVLERPRFRRTEPTFG